MYISIFMVYYKLLVCVMNVIKAFELSDGDSGYEAALYTNTIFWMFSLARDSERSLSSCTPLPKSPDLAPA